MNELDDVFQIIANLGVSDPSNPSVEDLKTVLDAYLKSKTLDMAAFSTYIRSLSAPLVAMLEALKQFSADSKQVSKDVLTIINEAIKIVGKELERGNLTIEDRNNLLDQIMQYVKHAREESKRERKHHIQLFGIFAGVFLVCLGIIVLFFTKNKEVLNKGLALIGKVH